MLGHNCAIHFSEFAFEDLAHLLTYTETTFGIAQKIIYETKLKEGINRIANMPTIGHAHSLLPNNLRVFNIEKHIVIYYVAPDNQAIFIIRIVHQKLNLGNI